MIVLPESQIVVSNNLSQDRDIDQMWETLERIKRDRKALYGCVMHHTPLWCKGNLDLDNIDLGDSVSEEI